MSKTKPKDADGAVLILGATSDIGRATAHEFASAGHPIFLAARCAEDRLTRDAEDIRIRHQVKVDVLEFDVLRSERHVAFIEQLPQFPNIVVCVIGSLPDQSACEHDALLAELTYQTNFNGPAQILSLVAEQYAERGEGNIIGVSSVAGDRGRANNYTYGAAKAGFTAFLSGLRGRFAQSRIHVMTVKPGFVRTRMTEAMDLPNALTASSEEVGKSIYRGWKTKRSVIYVRPIWRLIMAIICILPEFIFKRVKL